MTLQEEVDKTIEIYEQYLGNSATATRQMIEKYGYVSALSKLMKSPDLQSGFKVLHDHNKLDYSFEQIILNHSKEFDKNTVEVAKWRLANADNLL